VTLLLIASSHASWMRAVLLRYKLMEFFSSLLVTGAPQVAHLAGQIVATTAFVNHVFYKRVRHTQGANGMEALLVTQRLALVAITTCASWKQLQALGAYLNS
jgi:hypothetical protein